MSTQVPPGPCTPEPPPNWRLRLLRRLRRLLPAAQRKLWRRALFQWIELSWPLACGLRAEIRSYDEWVVYNEIFVSADYDPAILAALADPRRRGALRVLDLGAHVGFFSLRVIELAQRQGLAPDSLCITAVEAHPARFAEYQRRIAARCPAARIDCVQGLVGRREGRGRLHDDTLRPHPSAEVFDVDFIDLDRLLPPDTAIDLLGCDIEGSEELLLEHYPELLRRVRHAVFEFHHADIDRAACLQRLADLGFRVRSAPELDRGTHSIVFASR